MRRLAIVVAVYCAACSLVVDLSDLGHDAASEAGDGTTSFDAGDAGDAGDASDAGDAETGYNFSDDFDRPDSGTIGNGWIAKSPAFEIASGRVRRVNESALDFRDLVLYRPPSEAYLDLQASVEVVLSNVGADSGSWEQLHVRVQPSTISVPNTLDAYIMFAQNGGTTAIEIARTRLQQAYVVLGTLQLTAAMVVGTTYRFTLHVSGTNPVAIVGSVERHDATSWTLIGSTTIQDVDTANAIVTPGVAGVSASIVDPTGAYSYDNFVASGN